MQLSSQHLLLTLLALSHQTRTSTACPLNRRELADSLLDGPWAADEDAKERILDFQGRNLVIDTCNYYYKADVGKSLDGGLPKGNADCFTDYSDKAAGLNPSGVGVASGNTQEMVVQISDLTYGACTIVEARHKAGNNCVDGDISGKTITYTKDKKDISNVQFILECPCGCVGAGCGGDPHVKRWSGDRYYYHGEGDLVLLDSPAFGDNQGLDIHVRTTIKDWYSKIDATAVRIGESILEISGGNTHKFLVDGVEYTDEDLPMDISGYTFDHLASLKNGKGTSYILDLNNHDFISFRVMKFVMSLDISAGTNEDFHGSRGMMGSFPTGEMLARDGATVLGIDRQEKTKKGEMDDVSDAMGFEWQVRSDKDARLFRTLRDPQWPEPCKMPAVTQATTRTRQLRVTTVSPERAQAVCAHKSARDFNFCVMDVVALDDETAALSW